MIEPQCTDKLVWWLGETKGFWVQTGALFLSAIGALWIVRSREKSERRRSTVEMVLHHTGDQELWKAKRTFLAVLQSDNPNFARFLGDINSEQYIAIMKILNTHEFVCGAILKKAYDEKLYKNMQCSVVIRDWNALCGFIQEFRKTRRNQTNVHEKTFYQDFEIIAERWTRKPLKTRSKWNPFS